MTYFPSRKFPDFGQPSTTWECFPFGFLPMDHPAYFICRFAYILRHNDVVAARFVLKYIIIQCGYIGKTNIKHNIIHT